MREELPPAPPRLIVVKFVGGWLAIGSGLALGREGPSVQMGANVANLIGKVFRRPWPDCRVLLAAGAGAGLATAFNAPIAGAVFVLEELVRKFELRIAIAALGRVDGRDFGGAVVSWRRPRFPRSIVCEVPVRQTMPLFITLGALAGLLGVFYNRLLLATLAVADRFGKFPLELRAAVIGGGVGALGFFAPNVVGGGDPLTQSALAGAPALSILPLILVVRFGLGADLLCGGNAGRAVCAPSRSGGSVRPVVRDDLPAGISGARTSCRKLAP